MAVVEPSYHGVDGGTDPPRHSTRVPHQYKSEHIMRNVRSKNRSLNLHELLEGPRKEPFPIRFDKAGGM
ncbi:hypothetical protein TorRG33x02_105780 [Trema orientale]|uniref:Uncharacterized protein n=1 Tax=Trema orientale TaxID=63057 RepID=A0A2P5F715_TREOI|nr:hypothetical protein TorRG33x02_105780 [Trema orientale]